jgi:hypothetical protein
MGWNSVLGLMIFVCPVAAGIALLRRMVNKDNMTSLSALAKRRRMEVLVASIPFLSWGPFTFWSRSTFVTVFRIRVRNARGKEWSGFARVGGLLRPRIEVRFDHPQEP